MTYDEFCDVIEPLYRQFRPKMPSDWKGKDLGDRYRALGRFGAEVLRGAVDELMGSSEHMPVIAHIRRACRDAQQRLGVVERKEYEPWSDALLCPCGCGGRRWSYVVREDYGRGPWRHFPDDADGLGLPAGFAQITSHDREAIAVETLKLAGKVMTRDAMHCKHTAGTQPRGLMLRQDSRGVAIYDLRTDVAK